MLSDRSEPRSGSRLMIAAAGCLLALALASPGAASAAGSGDRAVSELTDHIEISANAFDGSGTQQAPSDVHEDDADEFDQVVAFTDDSPAGEVRTGTGTATETVKVVETDAHDVLEVHVAGTADGSFDDGDPSDGDFPNGTADAEFRISFDVTDTAAIFSLTGSASASSIGVGARLRGGTPCSRVRIGVPDGTISEVLTPSICGSPASRQFKLRGEVQPGQHELTVSAVAAAFSQGRTHHGHAQVQFSLDLAVAQCDVTGTPQGERLDGTDEPEVICGMGGQDNLFGGGGDDTIIGGGQVDHILGQAGNDLIFGQGGDDDIGGGANDDVIFAGDGCDDVGGGEGDDRIHGGDEPAATRVCDQLDGGADQDSVLGERGPSRLEGGTGNDVVEGGPNNDLIFDAGGPNALLSGGGGRDGICGSPDPDFIEGGDGGDFLTGNEGVDTIHGQVGDDVIAGGGGGFRRPGGEALCVPDPEAVDEHDFLFGEADDDEMTGGPGTNDKAKVNRALDDVDTVEHVTRC